MYLESRACGGVADPEAVSKRGAEDQQVSIDGDVERIGADSSDLSCLVAAGVDFPEGGLRAGAAEEKETCADLSQVRGSGAGEAGDKSIRNSVLKVDIADLIIRGGGHV